MFAHFPVYWSVKEVVFGTHNLKQLGPPIKNSKLLVLLNFFGLSRWREILKDESYCLSEKKLDGRFWKVKVFHSMTEK